MKNFPALVTMLVVLTIGCGRQATGDASDEPQPSAGQPAGHPTSAQAGGFTGTVLEAFDSAGYTYLRLDTAEGEIWAAVAQASVTVGAEVVVESPMVMQDFKSTSLDRTFESIVFGNLAGAPGQTAAARTSPVETGGAVAVDPTEAEDGHTVAELYEMQGELSGKSVTLRGEVVKYNPGIMGRNWIHLQDGTGDAGAGTHDITMTTLDKTSVGEVIEIQGVVTLDKDFGAGYRYAVIVEEAKIRQ